MVIVKIKNVSDNKSFYYINFKKSKLIKNN